MHVYTVVITMQVAKALEELNKRIYEHDKNITLGGVKEDVTLKVICEVM